MTESYQAKRERMLRAQASLPAHLQGRISLRNAEAAAVLSPEAQSTLAAALDNGLVKVAQAMQMLSRDPRADLAPLLPDSRRKQADPVGNEPSRSAAGLAELTALLQTCYPDMPVLAAQALADSPALDGLRAVFLAQQSLFAARQVHPDFVIVAFAGLLQQMQERLEARITQSPTYQQALRQSGLDWKP